MKPLDRDSVVVPGDSASFGTINLPPKISRPVVTEGFIVELPGPPSNWWWRLWHRAFFGFKWELM